MKSIWEKFKKLPEPLRKVIGLRMIVGGAALVLFIIILAITGDITLRSEERRVGKECG